EPICRRLSRGNAALRREVQQLAAHEERLAVSTTDHVDAPAQRRSRPVERQPEINVRLSLQAGRVLKCHAARGELQLPERRGEICEIERAFQLGASSIDQARERYSGLSAGAE